MINGLLTIAIPVYERYDFFEEAINSCLEQTIPVNIIVVDNNSSHTRFKDFVNALGKSEVRYFRNSSNVGMVENWNRCIDFCETEWISILHDDDWLHPQFAEAIIAQINKKIDADCIIVDCGIRTEKKDEFTNYNLNTTPRYINKYSSYMMISSFSFFPGVAFKKSLAKTINGFDPKMYPIADYDFWVRISQVTKVARIFHVMAYYRFSPLQTTSAASKQIIKTVYSYKKKLSARANPITKFFSTYDTFWLFQFYKSFNFVQRVEEIDDKKLQREFKFYAPFFNISFLNKVSSKLYIKYKNSLLTDVVYKR